MLPQAFQLIYGINSDECRIKTGEKIFLFFSLLRGVVISFEGCYLCSKGRQIYESEIYKLIFSPVFINKKYEVKNKYCTSLYLHSHTFVAMNELSSGFL